MSAAWDLPTPFIHRVAAQGPDIDAYGHVNNSVYLRWLDETAWAHSTALGISPEDCVRLARGMVVWKSQLNYLAPAFAGDGLEIATWLVFIDGRLRADRRFQILRPADPGLSVNAAVGILFALVFGTIAVAVPRALKRRRQASSQR